MPQDDDGDCGTSGAVLSGGSWQGDLLQQERESGEGGTETWRGTTTTTTTVVFIAASGLSLDSVV